MEDFVALLLEHLPEVIGLLVSGVSFVVVLIKTKSLNEAIKSYKECILEMQKGKTYSQDFADARFKTQYRYNASTGLLEELPTKLDIQALIESNRETCLSQVLEKFLPTSTIVDNVAVVNKRISKLDEMLELTKKAESYKKSFCLDDNLSIGEVFAEVQRRADTAKSELARFIAEKEITENEKNDIKTKE